MVSKKLFCFGIIVSLVSFAGAMSFVFARQPIDGFEAHHPIHVRGEDSHGNITAIAAALRPDQTTSLTPTAIKSAYKLPATGGSGTTIAIVDAYNDPNIENDLNVFSKQFGLPSVTSANFSEVLMSPRVQNDSGWGLEESLDTQWAHAVAPSAKILLVIAKSASGNDLLAAVDYARSQRGVVAVSMSWGGSEFSGESSYDSYFTSKNGNSITFFAASGDGGHGVEWPAVSSNVVGVGGTTLTLAANGAVSSETAWSGSGGGLSGYESEPGYQTTYNIPNDAKKYRAVPDVSYDADPNSGVSVYDSYAYQGYKGWFVVGGTSVGAPQWAAIKALGGTASNQKFYPDASGVSYASYFRDIMSGGNGSCALYCTASGGYDYVTGLGSPLTTKF